LRLTEVLKERDAQIEMKKLIEKINREQEDEEYKQSIVNINDQAKAEEELLAKKRLERAKLTDYHKAQ
jgi:hypothetical protein